MGVIASSNFLVPNGTLIVEIVAFLIVLFVIGKYVLPPLNRTLEERQQQIRASLAQAEEARAEADETRAQRQQILDEARQQAREVVAQANATAERLRTEAVDRAQQEHDRILAAAEDEIAAARRRAVEEVSAQLGALAMAVARQVVGREVDASAHRALIDEAVAALQASSDAAATQS
jgi:F-type H+-transporting ATPase subunit b